MWEHDKRRQRGRAEFIRHMKANSRGKFQTRNRDGFSHFLSLTMIGSNRTLRPVCGLSM